jgi:hypothetical protein
MSDLRKSLLQGNESAQSILFVKTSAKSLLALARYSGDIAFSTLVPTLQAQILSLEGKYLEAIVKYGTCLSSEVVPELARFQANLTADLAWCHARNGEFQISLDLVSMAVQKLGELTQIDEIASTYSLLALVVQLVGKPIDALNFRRLAEDSWFSFERLQGRIVEELSILTIQGSVVSG